jgi:hypothetical protein
MDAENYPEEENKETKVCFNGNHIEFFRSI